MFPLGIHNGLHWIWSCLLLERFIPEKNSYKFQQDIIKNSSNKSQRQNFQQPPPRVSAFVTLQSYCIFSPLNNLCVYPYWFYVTFQFFSKSLIYPIGQISDKELLTLAHPNFSLDAFLTTLRYSASFCQTD